MRPPSNLRSEGEIDLARTQEDYFVQHYTKRPEKFKSQDQFQTPSGDLENYSETRKQYVPHYGHKVASKQRPSTTIR